MDTKEGSEGGKECCSKGKCCGGKALIAFALLAAGGIGGFLCGRSCPVKDVPAASAPALTK